MDIFDSWYYLCCSTCDLADLAGLIGYRTEFECEEARQTFKALGQVVSQCMQCIKDCEVNGVVQCPKP